jgi:isopentenyl diphosphate isomerase/L-lactate dehydrogenase-like FMN-dependent dehydrogenase
MRLPTTRTIGGPRRAAVGCGADGIPMTVGDRTVECVRDEWRVDESWWTDRPIHRRYFELVLRGGADVVVFADCRSGEWWVQRG